MSISQEAQLKPKRSNLEQLPTPIVNVPESAEIQPQFIGDSQMFTWRADFGNYSGTLTYRLNWNIINRNSRIFVSASEGFIGDAVYTVHNISPEEGYVLVRMSNPWSYPLRVYMDFLVINA